MLILLPPSEGKTAPAHGGPIDLGALSHPELNDARQRVGDALVKVSGQRNALQVLGAGASLHAEVERNARIWIAPAAPAAQVYAGVLYDAAGMAGWDDATLARAQGRIRITSALWGAVSPADRIPAYRLSAGTTLGRLGNVTSFWRPRLAATLGEAAQGGLIVDCRSSGYAAMWAPPGDQTVAVRVERELNGKRAVVSHFAKHWRGLLTARLIAQPHDVATPHQLAAVASDIPGVISAELRPGVLTLVVT